MNVNFETSLVKGIKNFKSLSKRTYHDPKPDNVHDLRVVVRKLRADFWVIPKALRKEGLRKAGRDLKRLAHVLGEQRKYDVALEDAIYFSRKTETIAAGKRAARKEVVAVLRATKRKASRLKLKKAVCEIREVSPSACSPRIENLRHQLDKAIRRPPTSNLARHRLRIRIKRARYLLEVYHHEIPRLKTLQEHLGRWHDLIVLTTLSGYSKDVIDAGKREWRLAEKNLKTTLRQTSTALLTLSRKYSLSNLGP